MTKTSTKGKTGSDIAATREQLVQELKSLRSIFRDIVTRYQTNLEAEILTIMDTLSLDKSETLAADAVPLKTLQSALATIKNLKLKPHKGRLKDIRQIDEAIKKISEKLNLQ